MAKFQRCLQRYYQSFCYRPTCDYCRQFCFLFWKFITTKHVFPRGILIGAMLCVLTSGLLMIPANMFSFDSSQMSKSFLFRQLSAAVLCALTIFFYVVWYWSKTFKDMTNQAIILISISSGMCVDRCHFYFDSIGIELLLYPDQ